MKLVTFKKLDGRVVVGELRGDDLYSLGTRLSMKEIAAGDKLPSRDESFKVMKHKGITMPLMPSKLIAVGRNYAEHAAELNNALPEKPLIFAKYPSCVIGTGDVIQWKQAVTQQVDWEGELCVVIGKRAKFISEDEAYDHIFGYTIANDVSARDLQSSDKQWTRAKGHDTFCPLGPAIVTKDDIPDPHNLRIVTSVNGETMQDGNTKDMIFKIPFLVSYLSQTFTLEAGDLILTGTPSGVGKGMIPPRFLQNGDEVSVTIEGIGTLTNTCQILDV
ncbi:MAG: fumarylacetoacetate hydrolase family protein [Anaerolineae bacterium]|nr:fumarylacetoacetate hydrolase family protein [Anaerolineae bacterium]MDQ7033878.1 fumarylacetoacetate hydrolase family protein [Anaerolineae bacterium]